LDRETAEGGRWFHVGIYKSPLTLSPEEIQELNALLSM
jgi:hypothetical protein